jgi:hypothetical protein
METLKRRSIQVGLLAAPLLFLGAMADGHGGDSKYIHACVDKRDGDVRIVSAREHCHRKERALHWVREASAPAPAPAPAPTGAAVAEVVDAGDVALGPVVAMAGNLPVVGIRRNGRLFPFMASNMPGFASLSGFDTLYFSGQNCDGNPYLARSFSPFPATATDPNGNGFGDPGTSIPQGENLGSSFSWGGCLAIDGENPAPAAVVPALALFASNDFTSPFQVR